MHTLTYSLTHAHTHILSHTDSNLELDLAVVVRSVGVDSKAAQEGVRVGDEIREVNRVKGQY